MDDCDPGVRLFPSLLDVSPTHVLASIAWVNLNKFHWFMFPYSFCGCHPYDFFKGMNDRLSKHWWVRFGCTCSLHSEVASVHFFTTDTDCFPIYLQNRVKLDTQILDGKNIETDTDVYHGGNHLGNGWAGVLVNYTWRLPYFPTDTKRVVVRIRRVSSGYIHTRSGRKN